MLFHETKYLNEYIELYPGVESYVRIMNTLVDRVQPRHMMDRSNVGGLLSSLAETLYIKYYHEFLTKRPSDEADRRTKLRHTLSIKQLRAEFSKVRERINKRFRKGYMTHDLGWTAWQQAQ